MLKLFVLTFVILSFSFSGAVAQSAVELQPNQTGNYPVVWPSGPGKESIPAWAAPGKIRFARWDGGRIETAKAFLSGWPGLNPPDPNVLYTMTNWYDPKTVRFIKEAGINLIWVTFSVGFSNETEQAQQANVRQYIAECHRQGIHVMAYESIGNIFWSDMFQVVPESKGWLALSADGKPVPYGAADYEKTGRVTRYMANLSNLGWRAYLMKRIDLAVDSGADGLIYDNNFGNSLFQLYPLLFQHAIARKKDFLLMANFHPATYVLNRLLNCITTEDGLEPGLYSPSSPGYAAAKANYPDAISVKGKYLVNNVGLLRIHEALADGWKPVMIEDGRRENAERMVGFMSASRSQLAMAESMMFDVANEQYVEGGPAHELATGDPTATATWQAIGRYNRFFSDHQELYVNARSQAPLAIVLDDHSESVAVLDGLAARRVPFNVIYERDVNTKTLSQYKAVAVLNARSVMTSSLSVLKEFVRKGGTLVTAGNAASSDEQGVARPRPSFFSGQLGAGKAIYFERMPPLDELAKTLRMVSGGPAVELNAPEGILYNVTEQPDRKRTLIHLLNYTLRPVSNVELKVKGAYRAAYLVSPDTDTSIAHLTGLTSQGADLKIPNLRIYSLVVLER